MYNRLVDEYPDSEYAKAVQPKIAAVQKYREEQEARQKAIADSIAAAQIAVDDSFLVSSVDSIIVDENSELSESVTLDSLNVDQTGTRQSQTDSISIPDGENRISNQPIEQTKGNDDSMLAPMGGENEESSAGPNVNNESP